MLLGSKNQLFVFTGVADFPSLCFMSILGYHLSKE